jgi:hypothetical protein
LRLLQSGCPSQRVSRFADEADDAFHRSSERHPMDRYRTHLHEAARDRARELREAAFDAAFDGLGETLRRAARAVLARLHLAAPRSR